MAEVQSPSIGVHLLCGFLGSGKTTRINALIASGAFQDVLFLVNDFGSLNIDSSLIESRDGEVLRLNNGCACCGLAGDLSAQLSRIRRWPEPPRRLVIEASGVARPRPLAQLFTAAPGYVLDQLELLVDLSTLESLLEDPCVGELVRAQLDDVEMIHLNRWTHLDEHDRHRMVESLQAINPSSHLYWDEPLAESRSDMGAEEASEKRSNMEVVLGSLASCNVRLPGLVDSHRLIRELDAARPYLLRAKGFIRTANDDKRVTLVQWTPSGCRLTASTVYQPSVLVLIGKGKSNLESLAMWLEESLILSE